MSRHLHIAIAFFVISGGFLPAGEVLAQSLREERAALQLPVDKRVPEEMRPQPVRYRGFLIRPLLELSSEYDTNIYAERDDKTDDFIIKAMPGISVLKHFNAHTFVAGGSANVERFSEETKENKDELSAFARGQFEMADGWHAPFRLTYSRNARGRSAPSNTSEPVEPAFIEQTALQAGVGRRFNRLSLTLLGNLGTIENEDGASANGARIVYSDNDRFIAGGALQLRYEIPRGEGDDGHILFASYTVQQEDYERRAWDGNGFLGISEDNLRQGFLAGFETNYKGLIFANLGAGYFWRTYDDPRLDTTGHVDFTADIAWNIKPKLTLSLRADRDVEQDNDFLQGYVRTNYTAGLDYELLHNWYLDTALGYTTYDYSDNEGLSDREEEDWLATIRARYLINRNLEGGLEIRHQIWESTIPQNEFERTIFLLRLTGRL